MGTTNRVKVDFINPGEVKILLKGLLALVLGLFGIEADSLAILSKATQALGFVAAVGGCVIMLITIGNALLRRQNYRMENLLLKDKLERLEKKETEEDTDHERGTD